VSLTAAQLEQRKGLLTASDAAAVLGLNPWKGPIDVYAEKVGDAPPWRGNWKTRRGHAIEPLLLEWLGEQKAPLSVRPAGDVTRVHSVFPWLGATLDGLVFRDADPCAVAEAKSTEHGEDWLDEDGDPKVADLYHPQVVVQMAVARLPRAFVVVEVLGEKEPQILEVERDMDLEAIVLEELDAFWRGHVLARVPPDLDDASYRQIAKVFQRPKRAELVPATAEASELARRYLAATEARKAADAEAEATKAALCALIGENEGLHGDTWKATWKWREGGPVSFVREGYRHFDLRPVGAAKKGRRAA
jgi:putative phage-type endonuclease